MQFFSKIAGFDGTEPPARESYLLFFQTYYDEVNTFDKNIFNLTYYVKRKQPMPSVYIGTCVLK